ncbi:NAD(P)-binding domain-containing protein [Candidatus Woesearchaeota archaeon]|nr:NAD(P)-binding domain-containing protein [Candidatus Woesearchaeota archaeon]
MVVFLLRDKTISVIGAGRLGTAVVDSLIRKRHQKVIATRRDQERLEYLKQQYKIEVTNDNCYAVENSEVVVLSVKPYLIDEVCNEIKYHTKDKLVISLAAAKGIAEIEKILTDSRVCRVITGISVYDEVAAYTFGSQKIREDETAVKYIFGVSAREVEEGVLADRTWIACDTGLIAKAIEHKINSLDGLSREDARIMYAATLEGIANNLRRGMTGEEIYNLVAGPGSFTGKLHDFLMENGSYNLITECVKKTVITCRK